MRLSRVFLFIVMISLSSVSLSDTIVTIKIVDDNQLPMQGVTLSIGYEVSSTNGLGTKTILIDGVTDVNGYYTAKGVNSTYVTYSAIKEGYYKSYSSPLNLDNEASSTKPSILKLKKISNPVPMFVRDTHMRVNDKKELAIPVLSKNIGYDLVTGDWVAPYGKGFSSDFIFNVTKSVNTYNDFKCNLDISFSNPGDGILEVSLDLKYGSIFRSPYIAPEGGYKSNLSIDCSKGGNDKVTSYNQKQNYFYRVRTKFDNNGNIIDAKYGKIYGGISIYPYESETAYIFFLYYLNPDGTRNMEYDRGKNLFNEFTNKSIYFDP